MDLLVGLIIKIFSNPAGQAALSWLGGKIWSVLSDIGKDQIAKQHVENAVKKALEDYEKVLEDQKVMAIDGLSEEEKNEIRKRKAFIQASILNSRN